MADPVLGGLFNYDLILAGYPAATQPGGPGTPVTMPTQTIFEHTGKYFPGCGHSINHWDCISATYQSAPSFVVRCPLCGYVQYIVQPPSELYTPIWQQILQ